jgi:fibronectin type 3 domain-containing protein
MRARAFASRSIILVVAALSCSLLARAETTTYTYDALGRLTQVNGSANGGSVVTYTYDAAGNRTQTTSKSESIAPSVPTGLIATPVSQTQINLSWSASTDTGGSGLAGYKIYRGGTQAGTSTTTSYSDSGLTAGTTYSYKVAAYDVAGNVSAQSSQVSAKTLDTTPPSVPTGLTGSAASATLINLSWTASTDNVGVTGYRIYRGGSQIGTSATTSYADSTVVGSTTYSYKVAAYDAATNVSAQSAAKTISTPDVTAPSTPTNLTATAASPSRINLSWSASTDTGGSGLAGYRVYRGSSLIASPSTTSYSDTNLAAGTAYSYTVRAYDNATNTSGPSNTASATTWPAVAASLSTTTWKWTKRGTNSPNIDPPVVCTGSGGSGSGYTYAWQWVSGDTQTSAVSPTSSSTKWSRTVPTNQNATYTSTWRCQVTDSAGNTGQSANVTVTFTMNTLQ